MFCKRDDVRPEYNFCNWWVWCRATLPIHLLCAAASLNPKAFRKVLVKIARLRRLNDDFLNHKAIQLFNKVDRLPEKRQIQPAMTYGRDVVIENPIAPLQHLQFGIPFCQSPRAAAGKSSPTDILKAIPAGREGTVVILPPTQKGGLKLQFSLREEQWAYLLADEDFQALSVEDGEAGARL